MKEYEIVFGIAYMKGYNAGKGSGINWAYRKLKRSENRKKADEK